MLERDETNKLTDAGKEKTESETFRLWFRQRQYWMQSCILAGASGSSWPSVFPVFGCTHAAGGGEGDSRQLYVCV